MAPGSILSKQAASSAPAGGLALATMRARRLPPVLGREVF